MLERAGERERERERESKDWIGIESNSMDRLTFSERLFEVFGAVTGVRTHRWSTGLVDMKIVCKAVQKRAKEWRKTDENSAYGGA